MQHPKNRRQRNLQFSKSTKIVKPYINNGGGLIFVDTDKVPTITATYGNGFGGFATRPYILEMAKRINPDNSARANDMTLIMDYETCTTKIDNICVASRGRKTATDGSVEQRLEVAPEPGKTNCLTTVAKDNLILQRARGRKPITLHTDKAPTLTQNAWEQNNLIVESACLIPRRTEYGKTDTLTTVQKDNLILQVNPNRESNGRQPYQQNRVYDPKGKAPALMDGSGGRTINVLLDGEPRRIRRLTPTECARLQTVPTWYKWVVSETQQYRMLGNGWTVKVIKHIFSFLPETLKN